MEKITAVFNDKDTHPRFKKNWRWLSHLSQIIQFPSFALAEQTRELQTPRNGKKDPRQGREKLGAQKQFQLFAGSPPKVMLNRSDQNY